jgi:hypothetical protein
VCASKHLVSSATIPSSMCACATLQPGAGMGGCGRHVGIVLSRHVGIVVAVMRGDVSGLCYMRIVPIVWGRGWV